MFLWKANYILICAFVYAVAESVSSTIGLYRENSSATENEANDPFGGNVRVLRHNADYVAQSGIYA